MTPTALPAESVLGDWQRTLLAALWAPTQATALHSLSPARSTDTGFLGRGLAAYRSHASGQAARSLLSAYPVLAELLGAEDFEALARLHWREQPPSCGDLACWGGGLATQIQALPALLKDWPCLADLARVEWSLHEAARAADAVQDGASLTLLASVDPAHLLLRLAPGTVCLEGAWPVAFLIETQAQGAQALQMAAQRLDPAAAHNTLVWRSGWKPRVRPAQPGEPAFLHALQQGCALGPALEAAPGFDFKHWLLPAVQEGLLLQALRVEACAQE